MRKGHTEDSSRLEERELLDALRDGDLSAYEHLWCRHHRAAMRFAYQIAPGSAEDLTSEAFTAVLHTITASEKGPVDGFRSYLFTTMRNTALRWQKERRIVVNVADLELLPEDIPEAGASALERAKESAALIRAFRALPERWQQVLWLSEVEEVSRPDIAKYFDLRPNAVSALLRRARIGLQQQWLYELVPAALRNDPSHSAALLPDLLAGRLSTEQQTKVGEHLDHCSQCKELSSELRDARWRMGESSLGSMGFAALGVPLAGGGTLLGPTIGGFGLIGAAEVSTGIAAGTMGSIAATAGIGIKVKALAIAASFVLMADGVVIGAMSLSEPSPTPAVAGQEGSPVEGSPDPSDEPLLPDSIIKNLLGTLVEPQSIPGPVPTDAGHLPQVEQGESPAVDETPIVPGRYSGDEWVPFLDLKPDEGVPYVPPVRPTPLDPGSAPRPSKPEDQPAPTPSDPITPAPDQTEEEDPGIDLPQALAAPVVATAATGRVKIAPLLSGSASPGATVLIEVDDEMFDVTTDLRGMTTSTSLYSTAVSQEGVWNFDLSTLGLEPGTYQVGIWQHLGEQVSTAVETSFSLELPGVTLLSHTSIDQVSAELDGLAVDFDGPSQGTICLVTDTNQRFDIPLDNNGRARRFIRFVGSGDYHLDFMPCEGQRIGPTLAATVEVVPDDQIGFGPFILEPEERTVLVDVE